MPSRPDGSPGLARHTRVAGGMRAVVVDDEPLARAELIHLLDGVQGLEVVGEATNGLEALELIEATAPQLVLLDIQMPGLDGFQVVERIQEFAFPVHIIFVTAYDQYALRAFEVSATDYLLKPVDRTRLARAVEKVRGELGRVDLTAPRIEALLGALHRKDRGLKRIPVRRGGRLGLIDVDELVYATISEGTVYAVTAAGTEATAYRTLEELESDLDGEQFVRVHRSYLANLSHVREIIPWFSGTYHLKMDGPEEAEIPLSRAQAKRLRRMLKW